MFKGNIMPLGEEKHAILQKLPNFNVTWNH
jgi:hypothetical protein